MKKMMNKYIGGKSLTYFVYDGSFTYPPCYGPIKWIIYKDAMPIAKFQLKQFLDILPYDHIMKQKTKNNRRL